MNIEFLGDLRRLELKPGDRFVLTPDQVISMEVAEHVHKMWREFVGEEGPRLLILPPRWKIGVIGVPDTAISEPEPDEIAE